METVIQARTHARDELRLLHRVVSSEVVGASNCLRATAWLWIWR